MGDILTSVFGGGQTTRTDAEADPISQELNKLRLQQLSQLFSAAGPAGQYANYAQPRPDIYTASPAVNDLFAQASSQQAPTDLSNLMSFQDYINMGLDESQNFINQIARPEILSTAALQGLENGGYVPEAIAKATAQASLPFVQGLPAASSQLTLAGPQARLANAQTTLTGANRAATLFPMADYSRALQQQDLLRQQGVVTTGLTGLPFTPTTDTIAKQNTQPLFNFFGQG